MLLPQLRPSDHHQHVQELQLILLDPLALQSLFVATVLVPTLGLMIVLVPTLEAEGFGEWDGGGAARRAGWRWRGASKQGGG